MLHTLRNLTGSHVVASDGETGRIRSFLFDDRSWQVRYLVVDVGNWLQRHDVVLPITALQLPEWSNRLCRVRLTKLQVHDSPDIDTEKPVSRQQEFAMREYFGPFACWIDTVFGLDVIPAGIKLSVSATEDPHLRSTMHMLDYAVWATDGELGRLDGFVMDEANWHIGYLDVKAGGWLDNRSVLIPTQWVQSISWAEFRVYLHHTMAVKLDTDGCRDLESATPSASQDQGSPLAAAT
jgi:uncharacterized protein YrrD